MTSFINFLKSKMAIRILSVIVAFSLWLYVMNEQNPVMTKTFSVPLEKRNLSSKFVVLNNTDIMRIKVSGPRSEISDITDRSVLAYVDLKDAEKGSITKIINAVIPDNIQLVDITPTSVNLDIDVLTSKNIPIALKVIGDVPENFSLSTMSIVPNHAMVYGASSVLNKITGVNALFIVDSTLSGDIVSDAQLVAVDQNGSYADNVSIDPPSASITVKIEEKIVSKVVPVKLQYSQDVTENEFLTNFNLEPLEVELKGKVSLMDSIEEILTAPIDLELLKKKSFKIPLIVPEYITSNSLDVEVTLQKDKKD